MMTPSLPLEGRVGVEWKKFVKKIELVQDIVNWDILRSVELTLFSPDPSSFPRKGGEISSLS